MKVFSISPLQIDVSDFDLTPTFTSTDIIIFVSAIVVIIAVVIIYNSYKKRSPVAAAKNNSGTSGSFNILAGIKLHQITRSIGLNREQRKMVDFALKIDGVTEPDKSINSPALLDRHFRRAYRVINQTSKSDDEAQHKLSSLFSARNMLESNVSPDISSTRQIKEDSTLVISHGKEKLNVTVISAKDEHLVVENPKNPLGTQIKLDRGAKLNVMLFMKNNKGFSFDTRVAGYSSSHGIPSLLLTHSNQMRFLSQRRFRRRQTDIDCNCNLVYVEGEGRKQRLIVDKHKFIGKFADISVGGCSLKAKVQVQVGAKLKIEFAQGRANVAALGQVLRSNRTGLATILHIKFLKASRKSMNLINAYVYEFIND